MYCANPRTILFSDFTEEAAKAEIEKLQGHPSSGWDGTITYQGWDKGNIESAYLICEGDQAIPPPFQEQVAQMIKATIVERCSGGHCAALSQPQAVVQYLEKVATQ